MPFTRHGQSRPSRLSRGGLRLFVGVIEDADEAGVAAVADQFQKLEIEFTLAEGEDFFVGFVAVFGHAVEVKGEKIGFHLGQELGEVREVFVAVMQVVNHANVGDAVFFQSFDDGDLIFRFAEPATMIVEGDLAFEFGGLDCNGTVSRGECYSFVGIAFGSTCIMTQSWDADRAF